MNDLITLLIISITISITITISVGHRKDATALMWIHIEHWWRVNGLDPGSREYDPEVGAALRKHHITLPFTIEGHHNDEFRALTHFRKVSVDLLSLSLP